LYSPPITTFLRLHCYLILFLLLPQLGRLSSSRDVPVHFRYVGWYC
jgi:hypothetical protein